VSSIINKSKWIVTVTRRRDLARASPTIRRPRPEPHSSGTAAGPVKRTYPLLSTPELEQVRRLMRVARAPVVEIKSSVMNLSLRRHAT
jgi:hypothetical protein